MPILDDVLSVFAPHACLVCGREGALLCGWCVVDAFEPIPSRCYRCKRLSVDSATCSTCLAHARIKHVWIRAQYTGIAKRLLRSFKFERACSAAPLIASAMLDVLPFLPNDTIIVAIPTATSRVRQRGYDHAGLLAYEVSKKTGLEIKDALVRLTQSRQVGADRVRRLAQLDGAYCVPDPEMVRGHNILLIDDVVTTGATLRSVVKELKRAGAKSVSALLYAQKQ